MAESSTEFFDTYVHPAPEGRVLVAGSKVYGLKAAREDRRGLYASHEAVGVDMLEGEGVDRVLDLEEPPPEDLGMFSHIDCMSVLEHSRRPWLLAANLERLLLPGGTLFVSVPFVWRIHAYPDDYWRFTLHGVQQLFPSIEWEQLAYVHAHGVSIASKIPSIVHQGHAYFGRTEACGFGVKK
jgi:SAM-dependent methyltransferase